MKENRLKDHVNELANENADLKEAVGKMRYKRAETDAEREALSVIVQTVSTKQNFSLAANN